MNHLETVYQFYDRSSRPDVKKKRDHLNDWHKAIGGNEANELIARMKKSSEEFASAEFEMVLHRVFSKLGYKVKLHVEMANGKCPDFLVEGKEFSFVCEATTVQTSDPERAQERRCAPVIDAIDKLRLPSGFFFGFEFESIGARSPNLVVLQKAAMAFVDENAGLSINHCATAHIDFEDWKIELELRNSGSLGVFERAVGTRTGEGGWIDPRGDMRARLEVKAKRYGNLELPFIVAIIDTKNPMNSDDDLLESLFGTIETEIDLTSETAREVRRHDGFFGHVRKPKNRCVSAVVMLPNSPYWSAISGDPQPLMVLNPWANCPIDERVLPFPGYKIASESRFAKFSGASLAEMLF